MPSTIGGIDSIRSDQMIQMTYIHIADYQNEYLTLSALGDGEITIAIPSAVDQGYASYLSYSKDKSNWVETAIDDTSQIITIPVSRGDSIYLKGEAKQLYESGGDSSVYINSSANIIVSGNIMSLLYGDNFKGKTAFPNDSVYNFRNLFQNNTHLINAENLILPATTLNSSCYFGMFEGCTALMHTPELPATTLGNYCYQNMFKGCAALVATPALPVMELKMNCYAGMFQGCTSLTKAPELPANKLASNCYQYMFSGCTSLTTAPELPATTLASYCYNSMFKGCTKLNYIKAMFITTPSASYASNWVNGVAATGTFVKNSAATWNVTGVNGIPSGWTITTASA